jgi:hypothetical protein
METSMHKAAAITAIISNRAMGHLKEKEVVAIHDTIRIARRAAPMPVNKLSNTHVAKWLGCTDMASTLTDSPTWVEARRQIAPLVIP